VRCAACGVRLRLRRTARGVPSAVCVAARGVRIRGVLRAVRCGRRAAGSMRLRSCDCGVRLRAQCGVRRAARGRRGVRCGARRAARCVSGLRRDVVAGPATAAPAERGARQREPCPAPHLAEHAPCTPRLARAPHGVGLRRGFCGMVHRRLPLSPVLLSRGESGKCEGIVAGDS